MLISDLLNDLRVLCREYCFDYEGYTSLQSVYSDLIVEIPHIINLVDGESYYVAIRPCGFEASHFKSSLRFRLSAFDNVDKFAIYCITKLNGTYCFSPSILD